MRYFKNKILFYFSFNFKIIIVTNSNPANFEDKREKKDV